MLALSTSSKRAYPALEGEWESECAKCGNKFFEESRYCRKCGNKRARLETTSELIPMRQVTPLTPAKPIRHRHELCTKMEENLRFEENIVEVPQYLQKDIQVVIPEKHFNKIHKYTPKIEEVTERRVVEVTETLVKEHLDIQRVQEYTEKHVQVPHNVTHEHVKARVGPGAMSRTEEIVDVTLNVPKVESIIEVPRVQVDAKVNLVPGRKDVYDADLVTHEMPYVVKVPQVEIVLKSREGQALSKQEIVKEVIQDTKVNVVTNERIEERMVEVNPQTKIHDTRYRFNFAAEPGFHSHSEHDILVQLKEARGKIAALEAAKGPLRSQLSAHGRRCSELVAKLQQEAMAKAELQVELKLLNDHQLRSHHHSTIQRNTTTSGSYSVIYENCPSSGNTDMPDEKFIQKCGKQMAYTQVLEEMQRIQVPSA